MVSKHIFISGKVQGVSFRFHAHERARDLKISGYIRNLDDGRVEVLAYGSEAHLEKFLEWLKRGPPAAKVESLEQRVVDYKPPNEQFFIRRDGGPSW